MIHTLMEVDSYPPPSSSSRLRGPSGPTFRHHQPIRMSKRERSPDGIDVGADRPSKRPAGENILSIVCSSGNSSQQHSEDWVRQAGGLRIDSPAGGNYMFGGAQGNGVAGPGPSTSAQMDEDIAMEDTAGPPLQQGEAHETPSFAQQQTSHMHPTQLILQPRSHSLPNPSLSSSHPYAQHWRVRNVDGSPLINVLPATPAVSQHSLSMAEAPTGRGDHQSAQNHMLQAHPVARGTPPLPDPTVLIPPLVQQDLSALMQQNGKNKRVAFGPRLDCEKCRQGEIHFTHVHYE